MMYSLVPLATRTYIPNINAFGTMHLPQHQLRPGLPWPDMEMMKDSRLRRRVFNEMVIAQAV